MEGKFRAAPVTSVPLPALIMLSIRIRERNSFVNFVIGKTNVAVVWLKHVLNLPVDYVRGKRIICAQQ